MKKKILFKVLKYENNKDLNYYFNYDNNLLSVCFFKTKKILNY
jgi:hypothetical protein